MQLDNDTLDVLKNFATINPSLAVKKGNTIKTISLTQSVIAKAKLKQEFNSNFAIYDLSNFISALSMFNTANLDFSDDRFVEVSNAEKTARINYFFADPTNIITPPDKEIVTSDETPIKFRVTKDTLADIIKAVSVLSLPEVAFIGDGEKIAVQAIDPKNPSSNLYRKVLGDNSDEFLAFFKIENIKLIANDYDVAISRPKAKGAPGIAHFVSPTVEYWIVVETHSKF